MHRFARRLGCTALLVGLAIGCGRGLAAGTGSRSLADIRESGRLVVLTRNSPTTVYVGRNGQRTGPEHELVEAFADWLGVEVVYREPGSTGAVLEALSRGKGDLAAAGLSVTRGRQRWFRFGPTYRRVTQQVVCRRDTVQPENLRELATVDSVSVVAGSSYAELLYALEHEGFPVPYWTAVEGRSSEDLLRAVWQREIDCTVADSHIVAINQRFYPELPRAC